MKFFSTMLCALVLSTAVYSQSLEVIALQTSFTFPADSSWYDFKLGISNISKTTVPVRVRVDKSNLVKGQKIKFCFAKECYTEATIESNKGDGTTVLEPGMSDNTTFLGDYRSDGILKETSAIFTFFNDNTPTDKVDVTVNFLLEVTSVNESLITPLFTCSPNPVQDVLNLRVEGVAASSHSLTIVDTEGRTVGTTEFNAEQISISTANLSSGTYAALLRSADGSLRTLRFVVTH